MEQLQGGDQILLAHAQPLGTAPSLLTVGNLQVKQGSAYEVCALVTARCLARPSAREDLNMMLGAVTYPVAYPQAFTYRMLFSNSQYSCLFHRISDERWYCHVTLQ